MTSITVNSILRVAYCSLQNHIVKRCPLTRSSRLTISTKSTAIDSVFALKSACKTYSTRCCPFMHQNDGDTAAASQSSSTSTATKLSSSSSSSLARKPSSRSPSSSSSPLIPSCSPLPLVKSVAANMSTDAAAARCPFALGRPLDASALADAASSAYRSTRNNRAAEVAQTVVRSYHELPTPKGFRIFGTSLNLIRRGGAAFLHEYCDSLHKQLGPIYRERLGPQECVFIADPQMVRRLYQNEGKHPRHLVPESWLIYNEIKGIERGLFFM